MGVWIRCGELVQQFNERHNTKVACEGIGEMQRFPKFLQLTQAYNKQRVGSSSNRLWLGGEKVSCVFGDGELAGVFASKVFEHSEAFAIAAKVSG